MILSFLMMLVYLLAPVRQTGQFYLLCAGLGFCNGYWTLFIVLAAELFGTNLRATVATSVPNFVRGATVPLTWLFVLLKPSLGLTYGPLLIGGVIVLCSLVALHFLEETFNKDLDYVEV